MNIELDYAVPSAALSDYITLFYRFRADVPLFEDMERADHAQLRLRLTPGGARYRFADGYEQDAPDAHILGPTTGAFQVTAPGPVYLFGAGITPAGWAALLGNDASAMVNRVVDIGQIFGDGVGSAIGRLAEAPDLATMVACGEEIVRDLLYARPAEALDFVAHVDAWLCAGPSPEVADLAAATGLSQRQIERKCKALYGAPPKLLARKYRALRAAVALVTDGTSLDDAVGRGFYDQSHMNREIKQFTGHTPGQIKSEPGVLALLTIAHRYALGGKVHPIISDT
jgi:AraC-like DNA-binding protein